MRCVSPASWEKLDAQARVVLISQRAGRAGQAQRAVGCRGWVGLRLVLALAKPLFSNPVPVADPADPDVEAARAGAGRALQHLVCLFVVTV